MSLYAKEFPFKLNMAKHKLPPLTLSSTSAHSLVKLLPVLVSMSTRRAMPNYEDAREKPNWWPDDIGWANPQIYAHHMDTKEEGLKILRKLVRSCYSYHGVEELLIEMTDYQELIPDDGIEIIQLNDDSNDGSEQGDSAHGNQRGDISKESDCPVYVCCFCLEEFSSHDDVNRHQSLCQFKNVPSPPNVQRNRRHSPSPKSFDSKSHNDLSLPKSNQARTSSANGPWHRTSNLKVGLKTRSQKRLDQLMERHKAKGLMLKECREMREIPESGAWWGRKRKQRVPPVKFPNEYFTKSGFCSILGLSIKKEQKETSKKETEVDLDCEITLVEGPMGKAAPVNFHRPSHGSPRTKSLMSQMSRDNEALARRRTCSLNLNFVEDEWADREALEEGRNPAAKSLLTLDLSSPLGKRIKNHVKGESFPNLVKDHEYYCRTEDSRDCQNKLRFRGSDYKVVFKKKKRSNNHVHQYKFNKRDKLLFTLRVRSGLTFRSRKLLRSMRRCKLVLKKMSDKDIKSWKDTAIFTIPDKIFYDDDVCITQIDLPQSLVERGRAKQQSNRASPTVHQNQRQSSQPNQHHHTAHKSHNNSGYIPGQKPSPHSAKVLSQTNSSSVGHAYINPSKTGIKQNITLGPHQRRPGPASKTKNFHNNNFPSSNLSEFRKKQQMNMLRQGLISAQQKSSLPPNPYSSQSNGHMMNDRHPLGNHLPSSNTNKPKQFYSPSSQNNNQSYLPSPATNRHLSEYLDSNLSVSFQSAGKEKLESNKNTNFHRAFKNPSHGRSTPHCNSNFKKLNQEDDEILEVICIDD